MGPNTVLAGHAIRPFAFIADNRSRLAEVPCKAQRAGPAPTAERFSGVLGMFSSLGR